MTSAGANRPSHHSARACEPGETGIRGGRELHHVSVGIALLYFGLVASGVARAETIILASTTSDSPDGVKRIARGLASAKRAVRIQPDGHQLPVGDLRLPARERAWRHARTEGNTRAAR